MERLDLDRLERLIDHTSLAEVVADLAAICFEKASHVQTQWQDETMAREWEKAGNRLTAIASQIDL